MTRGERNSWAVATVAGLLIVAGAVWLLGRPAVVPPADRPIRPVAFQLARPGTEDGILRDEFVLRDPRPLFLPTPFNASLPEPRREAGRALFELDRAGDDVGESDAAVVRELPPVALLNGIPAAAARGTDALVTGQGEVGITGLGRGNRAVDPIAPRGAFVHVFSAATGTTVISEGLAPSLAPAGGKSWEPLEIYAVVDAAGLAAPLAVISTSSVDEVDAHFRRVLDQGFRLGERLPPGFFRVIVGP